MLKVDFQEFTQNPTNDERAVNRDFLGYGLTNPKPILAGGVYAAREEIKKFAEEKDVIQFLAVIHICELRCMPDERVGTVELYENGMNLFLKNVRLDFPVGAFRWRKSTE